MIFSFDGKNSQLIGLKDPAERLIQGISDTKNLNLRQLTKRVQQLRIGFPISSPTKAEEYADMFAQEIASRLAELKYPDNTINALIAQLLFENQTMFAIIPDQDELNNRDQYISNLPPYVINARGTKTTKLPKLEGALAQSNDLIPALTPVIPPGGVAQYNVMDSGLPQQFTFQELKDDAGSTLAASFELLLTSNIKSILTRQVHDVNGAYAANQALAGAVLGAAMSIDEMMGTDYYTLAFPGNIADGSKLKNISLHSVYYTHAAPGVNVLWSDVTLAVAPEVRLVNSTLAVRKNIGNMLKEFLIAGIEQVQNNFTGPQFAKVSGLVGVLQGINFNVKSSRHIKKAVIEHLLT